MALNKAQVHGSINSMQSLKLFSNTIKHSIFIRYNFFRIIILTIYVDDIFLTRSDTKDI